MSTENLSLFNNLTLLKSKLVGLIKSKVKNDKELKKKPTVIDRSEIEPYRPDGSIKFPWDARLHIYDDFDQAMDLYESGDYTLLFIGSSSEGGPYWDVSPRTEITKLNQRETIEALVAGGIDKDAAAKEVISWSK
ncbi:hypothetical protein [Photobacterium damselae]|uniref:Uncharacterized protein n=1 Tax=Photobacterium damselae subsp. damselae TaxID=85581 RepID=A0AAD3WUN2_PHODD|nr:hypothetical protein [Photobacterium damselae]KAB1179972.1 hypothetical protein F6450_12370 [Photobacterium damselae subsp. damselae]